MQGKLIFILGGDDKINREQLLHIGATIITNYNELTEKCTWKFMKKEEIKRTVKALNDILNED